MRIERMPQRTSVATSWLLVLVTWLVCVPEARTQVLRGHGDRVFTVAFSPDGKTLASGGMDKTIRLWSVATVTQQAILRGPKLKGVVRKLAFAPDGKTLLAVVGAEEDTVIVYDVTNRKERARFACEKDANPLAISPDGKAFTSNGPKHEVQLRDVRTGKVIVAFRGHRDEVRGAVFSRDGKTLVTTARDTTIRVWDTATGKLRRSIKEDAHAVALSPDGKTIASSWVLKELKLRDLATGEEKASFKRDEQVYPLAYFPDGKVLAAGFHDAVLLLDGRTAKRLKKLPVGFVLALAVSRDGKHLAAVGPDEAKSIQLWRMADVLPKPANKSAGKE